jgi:23S rRNA (adenine2503-C2)-methyltransferase
MDRLQARFPRVNVAVSLHSSRPEVRERLMPIARKHSLGELRAAMDRLARTRRKGIMIEVLMLRGVNDTAEDLDHLADYLDGLRCHVNLIPYNPIPYQDWGPSSGKRIRAFAEGLERRGVSVAVRETRGRDIDAACGQLRAHTLVQIEKRAATTS